MKPGEDRVRQGLKDAHFMDVAFSIKCGGSLPITKAPIEKADQIMGQSSKSTLDRATGLRG
jgi:hypothetical protein